MMRRLTPVACLSLAAALVCLAGGAKGPNRGRIEVDPVVGKLLVNGVPAANAMVAFHPLGTGGPAALRPVGVTGPDGTFCLTSYEAGDGAPAGEYAVTAVWPDYS